MMNSQIKVFILAFIFLVAVLNCSAYGDIRPLPLKFTDVLMTQTPKFQAEQKMGAIWVTLKNTLEIRLDDGNVISIDLKTGEVDWGKLELSDASICFWLTVTSFLPAIKHNIILDYIYKERPGAAARVK